MDPITHATYELVYATYGLIVVTLISAVAIFRATRSAPLNAFRAQNKWQREQDRKNLFKTLMTKRKEWSLSTAPKEIVDAINRISLEFDSVEYKETRLAAERLVAHLSNGPLISNDDVQNRINIAIANNKNKELMADLLLAMGKSLNYDVSLVHIESGGYHSQQLIDEFNENQTIRKQTANDGLKVQITKVPENGNQTPTS